MVKTLFMVQSFLTIPMVSLLGLASYYFFCGFRSTHSRPYNILAPYRCFFRHHKFMGKTPYPFGTYWAVLGKFGTEWDTPARHSAFHVLFPGHFFRFRHIFGKSHFLVYAHQVNGQQQAAFLIYAYFLKIPVKRPPGYVVLPCYFFSGFGLFHG